jgi:putative two-component system hydrogenase maturation factor HypX/HoxX
MIHFILTDFNHQIYRRHFMRILFFSTVYNSLSQRAFVELTDRGHEVEVSISMSEESKIEAVSHFKPDIIICPFLKTAIPESIWKDHLCIIIHPGIKGDRGPSSIDWAILNKNEEWGVTLLQADEEMDAGNIWASHNFKMPAESKSCIYRQYVAQAAIKGLLEVISKFERGGFTPEPLDYHNKNVKGRLLPVMKQSDRKIDWSESTETVIRKIRCGDSNPGVLDELFGEQYYIYGAHEEDTLTGRPEEILAQRDGAVCRATGDGAVWITHLKKKGEFKLLASFILEDKLRDIPDAPLSPLEEYSGRTYRELWYKEIGEVSYLHFEFYNGAMSTKQCMQLKNTFIEIKKRDTKVIVLMGGRDFWSNGIHLNTIEYAANPVDESWKNINAMNDLIHEIINTNDKLIISAMQGNAGAGGVILGLAADYVYAREGIVLNPHYKNMGGLYGSEYWTYLLPKRVGNDMAFELTETCMPVSTHRAKLIGLIDDAFGTYSEDFCKQIEKIASELSSSRNFDELLLQKKRKRLEDEAIKPLESYRREELKQMHINFYGVDKSYHTARRNFVYKIPCAETR